MMEQERSHVHSTQSASHAKSLAPRCCAPWALSLRVPGPPCWEHSEMALPKEESVLCCQRELVKNPPAMRETWVQSLGWEDPPGVGKGYPLQYSGLEHSMGCIVHGVTKSWTRLSDFHLEGAAPRRERWVETHRTLGSGILSNSSGPA